MSEPLRVLIVEDSEEDAGLLVVVLHRGGFEPDFERVATAEAMRAALETRDWDVVLSDFALPAFSGPEALALLKEMDLDLPFIVVSGRIDPESAVEMMRSGAHDFLMKDNLTRLAPAIERELREVKNRRQRKMAVEALRREKERAQQYMDIAGVILVIIDTDQRITLINKMGCKVLGYEQKELIGRNWFDTCIPGPVREQVRGVFSSIIAGEIEPDGGFENVVLTRGGEERIIAWKNTVLRNEVGQVHATLSSGTDITHRVRLDAEIRKSRTHYLSLFRDSPTPLWEADLSGIKSLVGELRGEGVSDFLSYFSEHPQAVNDCLARIRVFGINRAAMLLHKAHDKKELLHSIRSVFTERTDVDIIKGLVAIAAGKAVFEVETTMRTLQGDNLHVATRWAAVSDYENTLERMIISVSDITTLKTVQADLETSQEQLRALAARLQSAREEERSFLARDIHDELGHPLTALKFDLAWLKKMVTGAGEASREAEVLHRVQDMSRHVDEIIQAARSTASSLRPAILDDFGITAALEWEVQQFEKRTGIQVEFKATSEVVQLKREYSTALFRIAQELLTNVARHSKAKHVKASLRRETDSLVLEISDDGVGINSEGIYSTTSLGILGIRERTLLMQGEFDIAGEAGSGTNATLRVPLTTVAIQEGC